MRNIREQEHQPFNIEQYFKKEYGKQDRGIRKHLYKELGPGFQAYAQQVREFGVTKISGMYSPALLAQMRKDLDRWDKSKPWDRDNHKGFDGNSGERYLASSEAMSAIVTHPAIFTLATAAMEEHPHMNFVRTQFMNPIAPYERRAFQWHHDGYSEIGLRVMVLLTDLPDDGQTMKYAPSTNKRQWDTYSSRQTKFTPEFANAFEQYLCSGKAGDVFVFNNHGVHRGQRNASLRRDTVLINFQPGLARNYPLPGIAPEVAARMSDYERNVFGVVDYAESGSITDFPRENEAWRKHMRKLYKAYTLPVSILKAVFNEENVDRRIDAAGAINTKVQPAVNIFVDEDAQKGVDIFKANVKQTLGAVDTLFSQVNSVDEVLAAFGITVAEQVGRDLSGDLDLPIRMYHPYKDQMRDNAITQTRDGQREAIIAVLIDHLLAVDFTTIAQTDASSYDVIPNRVLSHAGELSALPEDHKRRVSTTSVLSLTQDLSEMIKWAYTPDLVRRTMLYFYIMSSELAQRFRDDERVSETTRADLAQIAQDGLVAYTKLLFVDKKQA